LVVQCCRDYVDASAKSSVSRANVEQILLEKLTRSLVADIQSLLPAHVAYSESDALEVFKALWLRLVVKLPGGPWKNTATAIEAFHARHGHLVFAELLEAC
jgi:hypothetical protein